MDNDNIQHQSKVLSLTIAKMLLNLFWLVKGKNTNLYEADSHSTFADQAIKKLEEMQLEDTEQRSKEPPIKENGDRSTSQLPSSQQVPPESSAPTLTTTEGTSELKSESQKGNRTQSTCYVLTMTFILPEKEKTSLDLKETEKTTIVIPRSRPPPKESPVSLIRDLANLRVQNVVGHSIELSHVPKNYKEAHIRNVFRGIQSFQLLWLKANRALAVFDNVDTSNLL
jgi:hypothetical protein